jgi:hypothetical protein
MVEEYLVGVVMTLAGRLAVAAGHKVTLGTNRSMLKHGRVLLDEEATGSQHVVMVNVGTEGTVSVENAVFGAKTMASSRLEALRAMVNMLSDLLILRADADLVVVKEAQRALSTLSEESGPQVVDISAAAPTAVAPVVQPEARATVADASPPQGSTGKAAFVPRDPTGLPGPWTRVRRSDGSDPNLYELRWWPTPNSADGLFEVRLLGAEPNSDRLSAAYVRAQYKAVPMNAAGEFIETANGT